MYCHLVFLPKFLFKVQEYYQSKLALNKAKETFEETKISLQKSLQEAQKLTNAARDERNMLIVSIIEDSKELRNLQEEVVRCISKVSEILI